MKFGILAHPAKHSLSPAFFNNIFKKLGIDAEYVFFDVPPEELEGFILRVRVADEVRGMSVSTPHKETVMAFLDEISEDAKMIGAVNTISCGDGKLRGFNTDYVGVIAALKEKVANLRGKKVLVLGAGGASRAVIYGLLKEGAEVCVLNRTVSRAKRIADHFENTLGRKISFDGLSEIMKHECDILIQTTSTWMTTGTDVKLVPNEFFKKEMVVMDIVYKPLITPLLADAKEAGCKIVTGDTMFKYQAERQYEIWFGEKLPVRT